ncbi:MAG: hypothetical protein KatS3mg131_1654 [Candidatus Tectimicrobiota bacterium]|nr:MAG: hypothetical protein KatS3mg131_1654 [Candidatus Tectomicrobia bacterium]
MKAIRTFCPRWFFALWVMGLVVCVASAGAAQLPKGAPKEMTSWVCRLLFRPCRDLRYFRKKRRRVAGGQVEQGGRDSRRES